MGKQDFCELTPISIEKWGKDHWSTFAYLETLAVDGGKDGWAIPVRERMRTNEITHPHLLGNTFGGGESSYASKYPTRLKEGEVEGHDDWDCIDDMVKEGLLEDVGSGLNRAFIFTKLGKKVAGELRKHKMNGGNFKDFVSCPGGVAMIIEELDKEGMNLQETILNLENQGYEEYYKLWLQEILNKAMWAIQVEEIEKIFGSLNLKNGKVKA